MGNLARDMAIEHEKGIFIDRFVPVLCIFRATTWTFKTQTLQVTVCGGLRYRSSRPEGEPVS